MNKLKSASIGLASIAMLTLSGTALANDSQQALQSAKNYAMAVSCSSSFSAGMPNQTGAKDVYPIAIQGSYGPTYMVIWHGDAGCRSGKGNYGMQFTILSKDRAGRFVVNPNIPNLIQSVNSRSQVINEAFIEDATVVNGMVHIISSELDKSNPNVSLNYRYIVSYQGGAWKVINKHFLGKEVD